MPAVVTDQFRILNASNFVDTVTGIGGADPKNSFYVTLGLPNPRIVGFGRTSTWDTNTPNPVDNINRNNHIGDTTLFGKRVTGKNIRRLIRKVDWTQGTRYEMYRHDYSVNSPSPITQSSRLYDASYYVINENFNVYICIDNGSSGINTTGNASQDAPTFTDLEPSKAGESGDGYIWKYLYTVSPSDIIKFDSTEFIAVPNDWTTTNDAIIQSVRENGDSDLNNNQIKKVYIENQGNGYSGGIGQEFSILGDGTGGKVVVDVVNGKITQAIVSSGGKGYTYGIVDLGSINANASSRAKLIPIIPPSKGHGFNIYEELGTDRVLCYARFGGDNKDFPFDTKFAQVELVKNPTSIGTTSVYFSDSYSSLNSIKFPSTTTANPVIGEKISQTVTGGTAVGYVASWDKETKVLKYFQDRSLYFGNGVDQTDYVGVSTLGQVLAFQSTANPITSPSGFSGSVETTFSSGITTVGTKNVGLGVTFTNGLATPEINKGSGDIIYIDNRATITRNSRQKEDVKIILEF
tara:strand:+ start:12345 stop:13904 length:1560 start_codon:yes stop_codon:yes gene_type:complete